MNREELVSEIMSMIDTTELNDADYRQLLDDVIDECEARKDTLKDFE